MTRRIGLLMTNTDESAFANRHPRDGEKFSTLMHAVRPDWSMTVYSVKDGQFPLTVKEVDGFIITGSPASVHDEASWVEKLMSFIRQLDEAVVPTVGCCFGHQAIAKALGGKVERNPSGWQFSAADTFFNVPQDWMQPHAKTLTLFAAHNEQVTLLPQHAIALGGNDDCPFASFQVGQHFFTTQYHPEMTAEFVTALSYEIEKYVGVDLAETARTQARSTTHGLWFAEWMAEFLEMDRT